jgi:hypothetical protein
MAWVREGDSGQINVNVKKVLMQIYEACCLRSLSVSEVSNQSSGRVLLSKLFSKRG